MSHPSGGGGRRGRPVRRGTAGEEGGRPGRSGQERAGRTGAGGADRSGRSRQERAGQTGKSEADRKERRRQERAGYGRAATESPGLCAAAAGSAGRGRTNANTNAAATSPSRPATANVWSRLSANAWRTRCARPPERAITAPASPPPSGPARPGPATRVSPPRKTSPSTAIPNAYPSCLNVLTAPPAMPARRPGTAAIAVADSGAIASPAPVPTSASPGITTAQPEPARITPWASAPAATTSSPAPTSSRGDAVCRTRPIDPDTTNAARLHGSTTSPAPIGLRPSTDWSHSDAYATPAQAAADSSAPATRIAVNDPFRSSDRSSIGLSRRRSTTAKTASAATVTTTRPSVRPDPHEPRISA